MDRVAGAALVRQGAEVERAVLTRAVQWHCQDRVLRQATPRWCSELRLDAEA